MIYLRFLCREEEMMMICFNARCAAACCCRCLPAAAAFAERERVLYILLSSPCLISILPHPHTLREPVSNSGIFSHHLYSTNTADHVLLFLPGRASMRSQTTSSVSWLGGCFLVGNIPFQKSVRERAFPAPGFAHHAHRNDFLLHGRPDAARASATCNIHSRVHCRRI